MEWIKINWSRSQTLQLTVLWIFCVEVRFLLWWRFEQNCHTADIISWFFITFFGITENSRLTGERICPNWKNILLNLPLPTHGSALLFWEALWVAAQMCNETENIRPRMNDRKWNPFIKPSSAVIAWTYRSILPTCWYPKEAHVLSPRKAQKCPQKEAL